MLDSATAQLTKLLEKHFTSGTGHQWNFHRLAVSLDDSSVEGNSIDAHRRKSGRQGYIRVASVEIDKANRSARRNILVGKTQDANNELTHSTMIKLVPILVTVEVKVNAYSGVDTMFEIVPIILDIMTQGTLNFALQFKVGDEIQSCSIVVTASDQSLEIPEIPVELNGDEDMPSYTFRLTMSNLFSRLAVSTTPSIGEYDARIANA